MATPEGFSTLTSAIISKDARATVDAYEKVLGITAEIIMNCPITGKIAHACLKIGNTTLFISDEFPELNQNATGYQDFYLYVENADNAFEKAKKAGWAVISNPEDMFWGDRIGAVKDPTGNTWRLAQKVRDVSPEEMDEAMKQMSETA